ncbi:uncharacterized protein LOC126694716 [Quercus robur]|uniref:uncharacterized protein LOC126694716 n=1 Tax=Quercus robur TaxID=38942 RepID=UPI002161AE7B|nr:uncharacterized protein LOC126694716 [Quercus robur]
MKFQGLRQFRWRGATLFFIMGFCQNHLATGETIWMEQTFNAVQITFNSLWLKSILWRIARSIWCRTFSSCLAVDKCDRVVGLHSQGHIDRLGMHACKYAIPLGKGVI